MPLPQVSPYAFPYSVQNPDTGQMVRIGNIDDLWQTIESFPVNRYIYAELICDTRLLIDAQAQSDLRRYFYSKEWGISPFPGCYDEQPSAWVDKVAIIQKAVNEAQELRLKRERLKSGNKKN